MSSGIGQGPSNTSGLVSPGGTEGTEDLRAVEPFTAHDAVTFAVRDNFPELWAAGDDIAAVALAALSAAGFAIVHLPKPGPLSDHHDDDCKVWYFGQDGEVMVFDGDNVITDSEGFTFHADVAREQAAALLAASLAVTGEDQ